MYNGAIEQDVAEGDDQTSFQELGIGPASLRVVDGLGFRFPTPIQRQVIPPALDGHDVIGLAETGSGKTAAFGLPLIERVRAGGRTVILSPTREIALQTAAFLSHFVTPDGGGGRKGSRRRTERKKPATPAAAPVRVSSSSDRFRRRRRTREELAAGLDAVQPTEVPEELREPAEMVEAPVEVADEGLPIRLACLIGGVKITGQFDELRRDPNVVVATPGRLLDHAERRTIDLGTFDELVLDEADHMLDLGFLPQIQRVMRQLPKERRTLFFSATMPPPIERLVRQFLQDPITVDLRPPSRAAKGIEHRLYLVDEGNKKTCIISLLEEEQGSTLVFTRRKSDAEWLCRVLERDGLKVERIHSDRSQQHRVRALENFRHGRHRILVATDVAARGIDIPAIAHVINFDLPETVEDYVHRAGRTARGAAKGVVSSIATWLDKTRIRSIERVIDAELARCQAPGVPAYEEPKKRLDVRRRSPLRR